MGGTTFTYRPSFCARIEANDAAAAIEKNSI